MVDGDDVLWLLVVSLVIACVVALVAWYASYLERRYIRDLDRPGGGETAGPQPDQPPTRYHAQVLAQSAVSYYVALFFAVLGFVLVVDADGDGRGLASAVIALLLAVVFLVESRRSRAGMLEHVLALRAEGDKRLHERERLKAIELVNDDDQRAQLVRDIYVPSPETSASESEGPRTTTTTSTVAAESS